MWTVLKEGEEWNHFETESEAMQFCDEHNLRERGSYDDGDEPYYYEWIDYSGSN